MAIIFLFTGVALFAISYLLNSQIFVFIGLGLTFWGALFLLITPSLFVEGKLMVNTISSSYATDERIIRDLNCKGKAFHIPPYPSRSYLPEHLKGLREMVVFVPKDAKTLKSPSLDELAEGKFLIHKPKGISLTPPGLGLLSSIENRTKVDFTKLSLVETGKALPKAILENYSLAKEIELTVKPNDVYIKVQGSLYRSLYADKSFAYSMPLLGCPIISSVACALAKSSGKPVNIEKISYAEDLSTIEAQYRILSVD